MDYIPTIGLEIHAQLKTKTKMFCSCLNNPDEKRPNVNICPVCTGQPGTLPTANYAAIYSVLRVGTALGGTLADFSEFDRKNYFYPDIPKGYQITQYEYPFVTRGSLAGVALTRIHLEEDTGRSIHDADPHYSLVDFNRAGVPLMELVTEPVITSGEQAANFGRELQLLLRYLDASEANMEKGEMRVEANISVARKGEKFGTKVEIKNLNSFRAVERAINYEITRQTELLEQGEKVVQETRGWDDAKQETYSQRQKESAHDYRYFPDPDLPKMKLSEVPEFSSEKLQASLPELPEAKRERYLKLGLKKEDADMFVADLRFAKLFDESFKLQPGAPKVIASYLANEIAGLVTKNGDKGLVNITPAGLCKLLTYFVEGKISSKGAKDSIAEVFTKGGDLAQVVEKYLQTSDAGALQAIVDKVLVAYPQSVADYKAGKAAALQFLVGQGMKESKGSANPTVLSSLLKEKIGIL
jgi:aspartyl-tRNA(Asn)/glutamyl-tRNA(Gln) amidotransferase subunit B